MKETLKGDEDHGDVEIERDDVGSLRIEMWPEAPEHSQTVYLSPFQVEGLIAYWMRGGLPPR